MRPSPSAESAPAIFAWSSRRLPPRRAHLVGICGTGMRGLATLLSEWGWQLSGSDNTPPPAALSRLIPLGLRFSQGHAAEQLPADTELLIYSPAISPQNPERKAAQSQGIPQRSYPEFLGELMQSRKGVCIAGTHGKSTTSAMTAALLEDANLQPSAIFGAELCDSGRSAWGGSGSLFVVESCEFDRGFLQFAPHCAAILSVEPDHFDCFADRPALVEAFASFAGRVSREGFLLVRAEDAAAMMAARAARCPILSFGFHADADYWATDLRRTAVGTRFRLFRQQEYVTEISLRVPGKHNVLNALAAAAFGLELGCRVSDVRQSLSDFGGIRRRFERMGSWRGVTLVDDYAHHPTAVETTLRTAREVFGPRRLWVAFQPHQVSRTVALLDEFAESFVEADRVLVTPVFAAREQVTTEPETVSRSLVERLQTVGVGAEFSSSLDQLVRVLDDALKPGDVLLTMGAGDIDRVHHEFTRRVQRHPAAGPILGSVHLVEGGRPRAVLPHSA